MLIEKIMTTDVHRIKCDISLEEAQQIFSAVRYHHLLVEDESKMLIGIISDRDVIRESSPYRGTEQELPRDTENRQRPVADFMSTSLITTIRTTPIDTSAILLLENNISCLPVVDSEHQIEGVVTWKDLLNYYVYVHGV